MAKVQWDIEKIKKFCTDNEHSPVVILKTPRAGDTVDNGMGVEFDLREWALIYKRPKNSKRRSLELEIYNIQREAEDWSGNVDIQMFDVDSCSSIDGMIKEMNETDGYEVQWRDTTFVENRINSELIVGETNVEIKDKRYFDLKLSYEEIKKYISAKSDSYMHAWDLFSYALRDQQIKLPFNRDVERHEVFFEEDGVRYRFSQSIDSSFENKEKLKESLNNA